VHDIDVGELQPGKVTFYWRNDEQHRVVHRGNWSEQTEDVLDGKSCGNAVQSIEEKEIRVKEAAQARCTLFCQNDLNLCDSCALQRLCEECLSSCSGITSRDGGLLLPHKVAS
jgi:hypothetical protein